MYLKPIIATAIYTGLRKGEILNLKWKDVDLNRSLIYVRENNQNRLQVKMVNDDLIDLFIKLPVKGDYLFHNEEGKPLRDVKRSFQTALRRAGIEDFRFHDLRHIRHTSCPYLTMRRAPIQAVQDHAGHSSVKMTMRYSHLSPAFQKDSNQLLNGLCKGILKGSEGHSEKIVKNGQKDEGVRYPIDTRPLGIIGGADRDRTGDLQSAILALSQLSYCPRTMLQVRRWRSEAKSAIANT